MMSHNTSAPTVQSPPATQVHHEALRAGAPGVAVATAGAGCAEGGLCETITKDSGRLATVAGGVVLASATGGTAGAVISAGGAGRLGGGTGSGVGVAVGSGGGGAGVAGGGAGGGAATGCGIGVGAARSVGAGGVGFFSSTTVVGAPGFAGALSVGGEGGAVCSSFFPTMMSGGRTMGSARAGAAGAGVVFSAGLDSAGLGAGLGAAGGSAGLARATHGGNEGSNAGQGARLGVTAQ